MYRHLSATRRLALTVALSLSILGVSSAASTTQTPEAENGQSTILAAKRNVGSLNTWLGALELTGLADTLEHGGPVTVFAPSDDAFAKLPSGILEDLLHPENREKLIAVLNYHVVPGRLVPASVATREIDLETAEGIYITVDGVDDFKVNDAKVLFADIEAANAIIHVIDDVVVPN